MTPCIPLPNISWSQLSLPSSEPSLGFPASTHMAAVPLPAAHKPSAPPTPPAQLPALLLGHRAQLWEQLL